jgi:Spy/CpxP family protein refolding chaperone
MNRLRPLIRPISCALILAASVAAGTYADAPATTGVATATPSGHHWRRHGQFGPMHVLHELNLTAEQKTQVKSIIEQSRAQAKTAMTSEHANHESLASTAPTDANYQALLATAKTNAANRIQRMSEVWEQVYALLTPAQKAQIPAILAAQKQQMEARKVAWQASHPQS